MKTWLSKSQESFCNRWLRSESVKENATLIMPSLGQSELALVLETIQMYVLPMNTGKAKIEIRHTMTGLSIDVSKEMS